METYIRMVKYGDIITLIEDNGNENPTFSIQVYLTQNIEDIGIYDDLNGGNLVTSQDDITVGGDEIKK
jgi:hypothetical protein